MPWSNEETIIKAEDDGKIEESKKMLEEAALINIPVAIIGAKEEISSGIFASFLSTFIIIAEDAPKRTEVLPVITLPSANSIAAAGAFVSSAFLFAA